MADNTSRKMARIAYDALMDKKAQDVRVINIENVSSIADFFLIASGTNRTQVVTLADNVDEMLGRAGFEKKQVEGYQAGNWILLDYGDIIVHIFDRENRLFYDLEKIWRDGELISPEALGEEGE
ncbi:MAG: ribosome silencing factor [Lachnospiraceae bacterium]|nr:ribosome silencing factor [Lachnospiraceae bacterium]